jgi:stage III sporulation protein AB
MIEHIEILLSFNILTIQNIFKALSENEAYKLLTFIKLIYNNMESGISKHILSDKNLLHIKNNSYLKNDEKNDLINFFSVIGKSDLNGQISNCRLYKDIFKKKLDTSEKTELTQSKSVCVMIIGVGFLIVVLLL